MFFFADPELLGVGSLLKKYIALLCTHIGDILPVATSIASTGCRHFAEVSRVMEGDLTGNCSLIVRITYRTATVSGVDLFLLLFFYFDRSSPARIGCVHHPPPHH